MQFEIEPYLHCEIIYYQHEENNAFKKDLPAKRKSRIS